MAENKKYWIVLVKRIPEGPYDAEQIHQLLTEKKFSRNDVAMQVSEDGTERFTDWKILWQFEEFDRRRKDNQETPPPEKERRQEKSNPEIELAKLQKIPEELMEINPEDLLFGRTDRRTGGQIIEDVDVSVSSVQEEVRREAELPREFEFSVSWLPRALMAVGILAFVVIVSQWAGEFTGDQPSVNRTPARKSTRPTARTLPRRPKLTPLTNITPKPRPQPTLPKRPPPEPVQSREAADSGYVPESVYEDLEAQAEKMRNKVKKAGRFRNNNIRPIGDEYDEDDPEIYVDEGDEAFEDDYVDPINEGDEPEPDEAY